MLGRRTSTAFFTEMEMKQYVQFYVDECTKHMAALEKSLIKVESAMAVSRVDLENAELFVKGMPEEERHMGESYVKECKRKFTSLQKRFDREAIALRDYKLGLEQAKKHL